MSKVRVRGEINASHRGGRGARLARHEEGETIDVFNRRVTPPGGLDRPPNAGVISCRALTYPSLLLLLILGVACSDDSSQDADQGVKSCTANQMLPADNKVGDFTQSGAHESATTLKTLTALIDGGADKYTEGGTFICMYRVNYASTTKTYTLELRVFDETDATGAKATYDNTPHVEDKPLTTTIGDQSRGHDLTIEVEGEIDIIGYQADMYKGRYLARVIADNIAGKDDALKILAEVASMIK